MSVCAFSKVMGKDKFRLGRHRKNEKRLRSDALVSILRPRKLVSVHVSPGLSVTTSLDPEPQVCLDDFFYQCMCNGYICICTCMYSFAIVVSYIRSCSPIS